MPYIMSEDTFCRLQHLLQEYVPIEYAESIIDEISTAFNPEDNEELPR